MTNPPAPDPSPDGPPPGHVASPCVRRCTLDDQDVCVGCGRTLDEITRWSGMSSDEQARCVVEAAARRNRPR